MRTHVNIQATYEDLATGMLVDILDIDAGKYVPLGTVIGWAQVAGTNLVLVSLDAPFYSPDGRFFVSQLTVHPSNLRRFLPGQARKEEAR